MISGDIHRLAKPILMGTLKCMSDTRGMCALQAVGIVYCVNASKTESQRKRIKNKKKTQKKSPIRWCLNLWHSNGIISINLDFGLPNANGTQKCWRENNCNCIHHLFGCSSHPPIAETHTMRHGMVAIISAANEVAKWRGVLSEMLHRTIFTSVFSNERI